MHSAGRRACAGTRAGRRTVTGLLNIARQANQSASVHWQKWPPPWPSDPIAWQCVGRTVWHLPAVIVADITALRATRFESVISLHDGLAALWDPDRHRLPSPPPPAYEDAARLYREGRYDAARITAQAVIAVRPSHAAALNLLGVLHRLRADFASARQCLERAAQLDPEKETAWINLGNVHLDMEDADAAVTAYSRALAAAPGRFDTLRILGNAMARAGRDAEAMEHLNQAVTAMPNSTMMLRDRARAHFAGGRTDAALTDLDAALAIEPGDAELGLIKAQMLRLSNRGNEAADLLQTLMAAAPANAEVHLALADALLSEEKREQANAHYRKAIELRPDDQTARGKLCWSLLNSRYDNEAKHIADAHDLARQMVRGDTLHPANAHAVQSALMRVADLDGLADFDRLFPDRTVSVARLLGPPQRYRRATRAARPGTDHARAVATGRLPSPLGRTLRNQNRTATLESVAVTRDRVRIGFLYHLICGIILPSYFLRSPSSSTGDRDRSRRLCLFVLSRQT